ncbi:LacI family DNA-binding transcriptional regulator [Murinocardiopsis flavida]|uniref:LacI family DNA-binding transcriptional regulator n=1 Tax=Murinocardiopsis flavida TaxID=645275 RepID=UPI0014736FA9|nr:LacI family DNA-binding transcriptional regulator [Murinocardiopsis flavida]
MPDKRQPARPSRPGNGRAKITDVAAAAGVSPAVVSRLLRGDDTLRIRDDTRERVLAVAADLRYTPNEVARALRRSESGILGMAVHDTSNPVYSEILTGAQAEAAASGYALLLADAAELARNDAMFEQVVRGNRIDGLLLQRGSGTADGIIARIASARLPLVLVNDRTRGDIASVALDDEAASHLATRHLIDLGHTAIGHLKLGTPKARSESRVRGWRRALHGAGLPEGPQLRGGHTSDEGAAALPRLLDGPAPPTAVVVSNVLSAVGAMTAARESGLRVPGDLSIAAVHDVFFAAHLSPPLTVVRLPLRELGRRSVAAILRLLDGAPVRHERIDDPPPELLVRGSTAPPR